MKRTIFIWMDPQETTNLSNYSKDDLIIIIDFHGKQPPVFLATNRLLLQK